MISSKLIDFIEGMEKDELKRFQEDILNNRIQEHVKARISQFEERQTICPVCNNDPGPGGFTLIFGPSDLRKKATFCGYDCLEYFIKILKDISQASHIKEAGLKKQTSAADISLKKLKRDE